MKAFAAICLLGVGAACPAAAEPFPNWDINRAALYASTGLIECANLIPASEEDREIVAAKPEVVFNQYVIWETAARNYLTDHWAQYSEYIQLSNLEEVIDIAVRKSNEDPCDGSPRRMGDPSPSYISLLGTHARRLGRCDGHDAHSSLAPQLSPRLQTKMAQSRFWQPLNLRA